MKDKAKISPELQAIKTTLRNDSADSSHTPPRVLYHYTSAAGLRGIIESKSIWLTDLRFMNDLSELQYAQGLIRDRIEAFASAGASNLQHDFLERLRMKQAFAFRPGFSIYSASFCESRNLLSQWRAYRGQGGGYALGIDLFHAVHLLDRECILKNVIYDVGTQHRLLDTALEAYYQYLGTPPKDAESQDVAAQAADEFANLVIHYLYVFKHPDFREEQEWRLVSFAQSDPRNNRSNPQPKFRDFDGNIIPYFSVSLEKAISASRDDLQATRFPFQEVVIGPTVNSKLNEVSVKSLLLATNPDFEPRIESSGIPLRWL